MSAAFIVDEFPRPDRVSAIAEAEERRFVKRASAEPGRGARHPFFEGWCGAVVARQGGAGERCGNRSESFAEIAALGFGIIDLHVVGTADGVALVYSDAWLDHLTNGSGRVDRFTADEVAASIRHADTGQPLERLVDVVAELEGLRCNIVVKNQAAVVSLIPLVGTKIPLDQVCLSAKCPEISGELRNAFPDAAHTLSGDELVSVAISGRWPERIDCAQAPVEWRPFRTARPSRCRRALGWIRLPLPDAAIVRIVRAADASGAIVLARTINDPTRARRLLRRGVDGLLSDHPTTVRAAIDGEL